MSMYIYREKYRNVEPYYHVLQIVKTLLLINFSSCRVSCNQLVLLASSVAVTKVVLDTDNLIEALERGYQ